MFIRMAAFSLSKTAKLLQLSACDVQFFARFGELLQVASMGG